MTGSRDGASESAGSEQAWRFLDFAPQAAVTASWSLATPWGEMVMSRASAPALPLAAMAVVVVMPTPMSCVVVATLPADVVVMGKSVSHCVLTPIHLVVAVNLVSQAHVVVNESDIELLTRAGGLVFCVDADGSKAIR